MIIKDSHAQPRVTDRTGTISGLVQALPRVTSSGLSDAAQRLRAEGKDVLTLYGAPYWSPPAHVIEAANEAAKQNENAPSRGFLELRRAIADRLETDNVITDPESQIVITNGAMHALWLGLKTLLDPGDEVVLFRPSFFFFGVIQLAGGVPVYADTQESQRWRWDARALEDAITPRTKVIVLNSPTNPTGYVATEEDLLAIYDVARKYGLLIISDECYDNMVYDGAHHLRVASIPGLADRTLTVCSFTKTLAMQPWRIGFVAAPAPIAAGIQKTLEWTVLRCSHVAQRAAQAALQGPQEWTRDVATRFQRSRDLAVSSLSVLPKLSFVLPQAAPFLFLNVSATGCSGAEFAHLLLHEFGVPTDDGAFFGSDRHVRFPFGADEDVLVDAAKRLANAIATASER